jgi:hypothetical protein
MVDFGGAAGGGAIGSALGFGGAGGAALGGLLDTLFPSGSDFTVSGFADVIGPSSFALQSPVLGALFQQAGGVLDTGKRGEFVSDEVAVRVFGQARKKGGGRYKFKDVFKQDRSAAFKVAGKRIAITPTAQDLRQQLVEGSKEDIKAQEQVGKALAENPFFAQTFREAGGDFGQFQEDLERNASSLIQQAIGGQGSLGADTNVQRFLSAPVALQNTQFLRSLQQGAQNVVQGTLSNNPFLAAARPQGLQGAILGGSQAALGAQGAATGIGQFNQSMGAGFAASRAGFLQSLISQGIGAASSALGGGAGAGAAV